MPAMSPASPASPMFKDGFPNGVVADAGADLAQAPQAAATAPAADCKTVGDVKFYPFTCSFTAADGEEIEATFHFREPGRSHIIQLAKAGQAKGFDAQHNLLRQLVHLDEKAALEALLERRPLLVVAYSDEVFKRAGAGAVFAGK